MKKYLLLLYTFFSLLPLWSQHYEAGIIGAAYSQAGPGEFMFSGAGFGQWTGFFFTCNISENLSLRSGLHYGVVQHRGSTAAGSFFGKSELSFSMLAELHLMELNPLYNRFSPYLILGSGLAYHRLLKRNQPAWRSPGSAEVMPAIGGWHIYVPMGAGVRFLLRKRLVLGVEMGLRKNFSRKYQVGNRSPEEGGLAISSLFGALRFSMLFGGGQRNKYLSAFYHHKQMRKEEIADL